MCVCSIGCQLGTYVNATSNDTRNSMMKTKVPNFAFQLFQGLSAVVTAVNFGLLTSEGSFKHCRRVREL